MKPDNDTPPPGGISSRFEGTNSGPIWTPDGLGIIYWSRRPVATQSGLYRVAADGSGHPSLILATSLPTAPTSISPDGDTLLFAQAPDGSSRIFSLALNSTGASASEPQLLHEAHAAEGQASATLSAAAIAEAG